MFCRANDLIELNLLNRKKNDLEKKYSNSLDFYKDLNELCNMKSSMQTKKDAYNRLCAKFMDDKSLYEVAYIKTAINNYKENIKDAELKGVKKDIYIDALMLRIEAAMAIKHLIESFQSNENSKKQFLELYEALNGDGNWPDQLSALLREMKSTSTDSAGAVFDKFFN